MLKHMSILIKKGEVTVVTFSKRAVFKRWFIIVGIPVIELGKHAFWNLHSLLALGSSSCNVRYKVDLQAHQGIDRTVILRPTPIITKPVNFVIGRNKSCLRLDLRL